MKSETYLMSHNTGLSGTQFSKFKNAGINDIEGSKTYHNSEVKYRATVYR
jgi:hypothetical protein